MTEYVVNGEDFTEWDNNKELTLEKVDRNGSHYYSSTKCPKCGGTGYLPMYDYVEGGICFLCDGTGKYGHTYKVMTEAYSEALRLKRLAKIRKGAAKKNAEFLEDNGFNADGKAWVVLGNTYPIKDELKAAGAKFSRAIGWAFPFEQSQYDAIEISKDSEIDEQYSNVPYDYDDEVYTIPEHFTLIEEDCNGVYHFNNYVDIGRWLEDKKHERELELKAETGMVSEYVGEVGEKITTKVTVEKVYWYETHNAYYGNLYAIYTMVDASGNKLVWKTSKGFDDAVQHGTRLTIKGTIKAHSEYKGEKQTELSRVKAVEIEKAESKEDTPEEKIEPYTGDAEKAIDDFLRYLDEAV